MIRTARPWIVASALLACSGRPHPTPHTPPPEGAANPLAALAGHWQLAWTRPAPWRPRSFTGSLVVRRIGDTWEVSLHFDQTRGTFELASAGARDDHTALTFAVGGDQTFELVLARDGEDLVGEAQWPDAIAWSPARATPLAPAPADLPGPALRPFRTPARTSPDPSPLSPADAFSLPWRPPPALSDDGARVWIPDGAAGGRLWTGPVDGSAPLQPIADAIDTTRWAGAPPAGETLYVQRAASIAAIAKDGTRSTLASGLGEIRWVQPRWSDRAILVASARGGGKREGGVRVTEISIPEGRTIERFAHPSADDVVLDPDWKPRALIDRETRRSGWGVTVDLLTLSDPEGNRLGEVVRQPQWIVAKDPTPHVGAGPIHLIAGGDLTTLGQIGDRGGFAPSPSPGQWADGDGAADRSRHRRRRRGRLAR